MGNLFWTYGQKGNQVPAIDDIVQRHRGNGNDERMSWKCFNNHRKARAITSNENLEKSGGTHVNFTDLYCAL